MTPMKRMAFVAVGVALSTIGLFRAVGSAVRSESPAPPANVASGPAHFGFVGSASCSSRGCHGGDAPVDALAQQNEYTLSVMYDRHTRAYEVLLGDRAQKMARNLAPTNPEGKEIPAHLDQRCLACHVTPQAAWAQKPDQEPSVAIHNWQKAGVSCEACHGGAAGPKPWLQIHTAPAQWREKFEKSPQDPAWKSYGFVDLSDLRTRATVCAGCHVGAPADPDKNIPVRDCNHDVMAAGHPRLNFELHSYTANMPPHWNVRMKEKELGDKAGAHEAKEWLTGRLVSAKSALELLVYRAEQAEKKDAHTVRWPEFAEYRCYSCHTNLYPEWRNYEADANRSRGTLPFDSWHSTLLTPLNKNLASGYKSLTEEMARPMPDPSVVRKEAKALIDTLDAMLAEYAGKEVPKTLLKEATADVKQLPRSWEESSQLLLALWALEGRRGAGNEEFRTQLKALSDALAFPPQGEGPAGFKGPAADHPEAKSALDSLLKLNR